MDLIVLDWTRMGSVYCLAGVIDQGGPYRVVRPLHVRGRIAAERNTGWSPFLFDGFTRWQAFEMVDPVAAPPEAPHLEDVWVKNLRPTRRLIERDQRRAILQATLTPPGQLTFGVPLGITRTAAYLMPGCGARSLASVVVSADQVRFYAAQREGVATPDYRVSLAIPGLDGRYLAVKDHFLLQHAEATSPHFDGRVPALQRGIRAMGEQIVVRLGLSRPHATVAQGQERCWLMADGFFSLHDPQP